MHVDTTPIAPEDALKNAQRDIQMHVERFEELLASKTRLEKELEAEKAKLQVAETDYEEAKKNATNAGKLWSKLSPDDAIMFASPSEYRTVLEKREERNFSNLNGVRQSVADIKMDLRTIDPKIEATKRLQCSAEDAERQASRSLAGQGEVDTPDKILNEGNKKTSQELEEVANEYLKAFDKSLKTKHGFEQLSAFVPANVKHKKKVEGSGLKQNPFNSKEPAMALFGLGSVSLVGTELVKQVVQATGAPVNIIGPSGSGKTRLVYEVQCDVFGFFFVAGVTYDNPGSTDLEFVTRTARQLREKAVLCYENEDRRGKLVANLKWNTGEYLVLCMLAARFAVYRYVLKKRPDLTPDEWLFMQLYPGKVFGDDVFRELTKILAEYAKQSVVGLLEHFISKCPADKKPRVAVDEAQVLMNEVYYFSKAYVAEQKKENRQSTDDDYMAKRTFFRVVFQTIVANVDKALISSGTGINMTRYANETGISSVIAKPSGVFNFTLKPLGVADVRNFVAKFLDIDGVTDYMLYDITGRGRFSASAVRQILTTPQLSVARGIKAFVDHVTLDTGDSRTVAHAVHKILTHEQRENVKNASGEADAKTIPLATELVRMASYYLVTGNPQSSSISGTLDLIEKGVCFVTLKAANGIDTPKASFCEPIVLRALMNQCDLFGVIDDDIVHLASCSPSIAGLLWEYSLVHVLHKYVCSVVAEANPMMFGSLINEGVEGGLGFLKVWKPMMPKYALLGTQRSNQVGGMTDWLKACETAIRKNGPLPSMFFLPEAAAGPDLVMWLPFQDSTGTQKKWALIFIQAKLKGSSGFLDAYRTVVPELMYHEYPNNVPTLTPNNKPSHTELMRIVRGSNTVVNGVVRMIVAYPAPMLTYRATKKKKWSKIPACESPARNHPHLATNPVRPENQMDDVLIVLRKNNASLVLHARHMEVLDDVKGVKKATHMKVLDDVKGVKKAKKKK